MYRAFVLNAASTRSFPRCLPRHGPSCQGLTPFTTRLTGGSKACGAIDASCTSQSMVSLYSTSTLSRDAPGSSKPTLSPVASPVKVLPSTPPKGPANTGKIIKTLVQYVWPQNNLEVRTRVLVSLTLLVGAKAIGICVPFLFKEICDSLDASRLVMESAAVVEGAATIATASAGETIVDPAKVALVTPVAALLGYGVARSMSAGLTELRNTIFASVAQRAIRSVSNDVFSHLHRLDLGFHLQRQTGALTRVIDRGSRSINFVLTSLVFNAFPTLLEIGMVTAILGSKYGIEYSLITVGTMASYVVYTVKVTTWRTNIRKRMLKLENESSSQALDSLLNYETVKYFQGENYEKARYNSKLAELDSASLKTQSSLSLLNFGQNAIFSVGLTASMLLAASGIAGGTDGMTVGDLVLINGLLFQLSIPLNFVGMVYREVRQGLQDMGEMFTLLETKPSVTDDAASSRNHLKIPEGALELKHPLLLLPPPDASGAAVTRTAAAVEASAAGAASARVVAAPSFRYVADPSLCDAPALEFRNTYFAYPQAKDRLILNGLNLTVPQEATVGVVGSSGCGKSTLLRLAFRLYDAQQTPEATARAAKDASGVFVYGQSVRDVSLDSLRGVMGVVPQDTVLFNDSIAANIAYGRSSLAGFDSQSERGTSRASGQSLDLPEINPATQQSLSLLRVPFSEVVAAARASHLHDTITHHFPGGYDTVVGERGLRLSGGEKSRVAIARAYLKNSPILLCDEMTASLDMATEESVMRSLTALGDAHSSSKKKTMVLVAHRLSTIRKADVIFVLDKGRVVEKGTHQQLLNGGGVGLYKQLWERQQQEQHDEEDARVQASKKSKEQ